MTVKIDIPFPTLRAKMSKAVRSAFQWIYRAWLLAKEIAELSWPDFDEWWRPQKDAWAWSSFGNYFGEYSPEKAVWLRDEFAKMGSLFTSKTSPITFFIHPQKKLPQCANGEVFRVFEPGVYSPCTEFFSAGIDAPAHVQPLWVLHVLFGRDAWPQSTLVQYALDREMTFGGCKLWIQYPCQPTPTNVHFDPWGTGKAMCSDTELKKLKDAYPYAIWMVDAAKRFLDALAEMSSSDRKTMWKWGSFGVGTVAWDDASFESLVSPADWFGSYTADRFNRVRNVITWLWNRFHHGTKKNDPLVYKCKGHKTCFEHFKGASAWHDPFSVGRITLCEGFFQKEDLLHRADTLIHENLHMLRNDSATDNDPRDVKHDVCSGDAGLQTGVCYGGEDSHRLAWASPKLALENIDNFATWLYQFYFHYRGCWPPKMIYNPDRFGYAEPDLWVPPPAGFSTT